VVFLAGCSAPAAVVEADPTPSVTESKRPTPTPVAVRTISGTGADGSSWTGSARMLGTLGGGVHIDITCPAGQDMIAEHNKLFDDHLTILVS
jgi:hypothetical protein